MTGKVEIFHILLIGGWKFFFNISAVTKAKFACVCVHRFALKLHDGQGKNVEFL